MPHNFGGVFHAVHAYRPYLAELFLRLQHVPAQINSVPSVPDISVCHTQLQKGEMYSQYILRPKIEGTIRRTD